MTLNRVMFVILRCRIRLALVASYNIKVVEVGPIPVCNRNIAQRIYFWQHI